VAGLLRVGFIYVKGVRDKLMAKDVLGLLVCHNIFGIADSWLGVEFCDIKLLERKK
jgi:hypothetical protein